LRQLIADRYAPLTSGGPTDDVIVATDNGCRRSCGDWNQLDSEITACRLPACRA